MQRLRGGLKLGEMYSTRGQESRRQTRPWEAKEGKTLLFSWSWAVLQEGSLQQRASVLGVEAASLSAVNRAAQQKPVCLIPS